MEREKLEELFASIKKDDLKSFSSIMLSNSDLNIRFGRFPILSLLYLYDSCSILSKYEKLLFPINKFEEVFEPFDAYKKFKSHAKKSLKIFAGTKIVYPIEMLACLDNRAHLVKYYKFLYKNEEISSNLSKIYNLTYNLEVGVSNENLTIKRKPLTFKNRIIAGAVCLALCLISLFSVLSVVFVSGSTGLGSKKNPILISTEAALKTAIKKKGKYYKLTADIELTEDFEAENFSGEIDGDGHIILAEDYLASGMFDELSGNVKNLTIYAEYENKNIDEHFGVLAKKSSGNIENVTINCTFSGKTYNDTDVYVAGMVAVNTGKIKNSVVKLDATISNERNSNAYISAIAGENSGEIINCESVGEKIKTDTVDIAGIVAVNNGKVSGCTNGADLIQTSAKEWNPNVAGIVMINNSDIVGCKNEGNVSSTSTLEENPDKSNFAIISAGVVCENHGNITSCENTGDVSGVATTRLALVFVGGICSISGANEGTEILISKCKVSAKLYAKGGTVDGAVLTEQEKSLVNAYIGGIAARSSSVVESTFFGISMKSFAKIDGCTFDGTIENEADIAFSGGVVGEAYYSSVKNSASKIIVNNKKEGLDDFSLYFTNVCGAVYNTGNNFFEKNYYVSGSSPTNTAAKLYISGYLPVVDESQINNIFGLTKVNSFNDISAEEALWLIQLSTSLNKISFC